ncbi:hypothetical protein Cantr_10000 [Candida viswanathii]|uniref:Bul1 N-terminal domain-containing protein n=1 Tax=Candida viswanathii TaxID=5486 RepID=A0A367YDW6_9ASCO|nr:hypothetical protein Cantr_10000 [Candida viswanathii]
MISSLKNIINKKQRHNSQPSTSTKEQHYEKPRSKSLPNKSTTNKTTNIQHSTSSCSTLLSDSDKEELYSIRTSPPGNLLPSYYMYRNILHYKVNEVVPPPPEYSSEDSDSMSDVESRVSITNDTDSVCQKLLELNYRGPKTDDFFDDCVSASVVLDKADEFEYAQGDCITGMLTLTNLRDARVDIDKVYVFLEGVNRTYTFEEKIFLSIVDYELFTGGSGVEEDGDANGMRLMRKGDRFKLGFQFKIPYYLLDCQCKAKIKNHLLLPPSLRNLTGSGTSRVSYRVSCYVLKYDCGLHKNIRIGGANKDIVVIPKDEEIEEVCDINYANLLNNVHEDLMFINKSKFEEIFQTLKVKPISNKLVLSRDDTGKKEVIRVGTPRIDIPYTPKTPTRWKQNLFIPIDFSQLKSPIKGVSAELIVVTGMSTTPIPIFISPEMLFDSFSTAAYEQLVKSPVLKLISNLTKYSVELDCGTLADLTKIYLQYTPVTIENAQVEKDGILFDLNEMHLREQSKSNKYGNAFNLVPNFQSCYNFREYFVRLELDIPGNFTNNAKKKKKEKNKYIINIPLKVTSQ